MGERLEWNPITKHTHALQSNNKSCCHEGRGQEAPDKTLDAAKEVQRKKCIGVPVDVWTNSDLDGLEIRVQKTEVVLDFQRLVCVVPGSLYAAAAETLVSKAVDL